MPGHVGLRPKSPACLHTRAPAAVHLVAGRSGLRARSREDVDAVTAFVESLGAPIVHGPRDDDWAPGYYSVLFEDPCGTRLEVNHVPGKGNLDASVELPLPAERQQRLSEP